MYCGMTKTWTWLGPLVGGVLTAAAAAQSQTAPQRPDATGRRTDSIPADELRKTSGPVPDELWNAYLEGLKTQPAYQVGIGLSSVSVEPERERLTKELERNVTFETSRWLD